MTNIRPTPTIILPRLPAKTLVGFDLLSFTSTEQFYGITDLTPGWHFLYTGTTESFSIRCGAWFYVGDFTPRGFSGTGAGDSNQLISTAIGPEIRIWEWQETSESLMPIKSDHGERTLDIMRWKANIGGLKQMGALLSYTTRGLTVAAATADDSVDENNKNPEPTRRDWAELTARLTPRTLSRILGEPLRDEDGRASWKINSASTAARDADDIPGITSAMAAETRARIGDTMNRDATTAGGGGGGGNHEKEKEKDLQFLPIDLKRTWREGAIGRERTEAAQDKSWALGDLIRRYSLDDDDDNHERKGEGEILGELQFCFLMILTLMNYSCLEQWKRLLALILACRSAVRERASFFAEVLHLLRLQLQHGDDVDGGLFEMDGDYDGNFLRRLLTEFRQSIHQLGEEQLLLQTQSDAGARVLAEMNALEQWVRAEYGWELRKDSIMRRGMLQLEDGEQVEMEMSGADEDDETGEYAPVIVDIEGTESEQPDFTDVDMPMHQ